MCFEQLLKRFWTDFGSILEAELALKSMSKAIKTEVKTNIKKTSKKEPSMSQHKPPSGAIVPDLGGNIRTLGPHWRQREHPLLKDHPYLHIYHL